MRCVKHSMVIAGILNRTLVVEMTPRKYDRAKIDYRLLFDIQHVRKCYGEKSVVTTEEYVAKFNETLIIDRVKCWGNFDGGCSIDRGHFGAANHEIQIPSSVPTEFVYNNKSEASTRSMNWETFMQELGDDSHRTIMIGSTFFVGTPLHSNASKWDRMFRTADIPFTRSRACPNGLALQPHSALLEAAEMFVSGHEMLKSGDFLGIHIRRTDFLKKYALNVFTIPQLVECIRNATASFGLTTIFIVTDAAQDEVKNDSFVFVFIGLDVLKLCVVRATYGVFLFFFFFCFNHAISIYEYSSGKPYQSLEVEVK